MLMKSVIFLIFTIYYTNAYRILVIFPTGSYSHQRPQQAISKGLAAAGHDVTIISPNTFDTPKNSNIHQININFTYEYMKIFDLSEAIGPWKIHGLETIHRTNIADGVLSYEPVKKLFVNDKNEKFDAVIVESLLHMPLFMAKYIFNATLIGFTSLEMFPELHSAMGNVIHPILHPFFVYNTPKRITFLDRIIMTYFDIYHRYWQEFEFFPAHDKLIQKHFPGRKETSKDLLYSMDFAIEGVSPVLGTVRPLTTNTVQIGFLHITEPQPLPQGLQQYLDNSKNGVIYLSFGSNVKSAELKPEIRNIIINTMKELKYDVLWKFEDDSFPDNPKNVKIEKWLPQQDLLAHKNIKLFITQGGLQSMEETIARGVPVVVIPFFGDQDANAEKMESLGIGKRISLQDLTEIAFKNAITEVIDNPKYKTTVKQLGDRIRDTPMEPVQTAVWWIEYAIRNRGAEHLKYKGTHISFIEYYLIDIIAVHLVAFGTIFYLIKKVIGLKKNTSNEAMESNKNKLKSQ